MMLKRHMAPYCGQAGTEPITIDDRDHLHDLDSAVRSLVDR